MITGIHISSEHAQHAPLRSVDHHKPVFRIVANVCKHRLRAAPVYMTILCIYFGALLSACDVTPSNNRAKDIPGTPGVNEGLTNLELLKMAASNMGQVQSYHLELTNEHIDDPAIVGTSSSADAATFSAPFTVSADVQPVNRGIAVKMIPKYWSGYDSRIIGEQSYDSTDGGQTWFTSENGSPAGYLMSYVELWAGSGFQRLLNDLNSGLVVQDDSPSREGVDGVYTRRMTANIDVMEQKVDSFVNPYIAVGGKTITFWVTTDISPTIRQMQVAGIARVQTDESLKAMATSLVGMATRVAEWKGSANTVSTPTQSPTANTSTPLDTGVDYHNVRLRITWKWSRINEDFGVLEPPSTVTVKSP